ncbi:PST family polysaccharide transporter [Erwinia toletana]|uniref:PST family polysaccharide transporter n=1 Tax=Winslowiella toletana TaxID=92490 RepID=A0ABS4P5T7_9GAMM|nr:O-antigen translocase [Winslowiella toletana]MBP2167470.1 PST family polysaccharide transporter [Winslowiella toletana]
MNLIKTSFYSGIAVIIRMATLLGLNKILAITVGPSGYALMGQFQNAVTIVTAFSSGAVNNGIVKYTSEYADDEKKLNALWATSFSICLISSLVFALFLALFSNSLANFFLNNEKYQYVFIIFSATLVFFVGNAFMLAVLNGLREIKSFVLANILGSLLSLLITTLLATKLGLTGALIALAVNQSFAFIATFIICIRKKIFKISNFIEGIDKAIATNLFKFALMAIVSSILSPLVLIGIRYVLTNSINIEAAGYWESLNRLSGAYLTFFTTTLSVYLLPRLSSLLNASEIKHEIVFFYKILIPVLVLISMFIYFFRSHIITLLFSEDFIPVTKVMGWQVLGDFFKMLSWVLSYIMLSKAMVKLFIVTEIVFQFIYFSLTYILVGKLGLESATISYLITYFLYFITLYILVFKNLDKLLHGKVNA